MGTLPAAWDPRVRDWFSRAFGGPTDVQARAWPRIAAGESVLVTAPTGSGKTLAAFLHALHQLATGAWPTGGIRVVYVSPLRALNNDVRKNLRAPLRGLAHAFGDAWPGIEAAVRSGDTPESERRRMLRRPPEVLVTTPESLNLLLASPRARRLLTGVRAFLLDEVHAIAGDKRGALLMSAVERLAALSGEFQRVAMSATVRPLETIAEFVGGYDAQGRPRPMSIVTSRDEKHVAVTVHAPPRGEERSVWPAVVRELAGLLDANRSTLFFVNNRMQSERLARWLNEERGAPVAWAHHGSLSRELRELVERKLKDGELKALVATGSLELGIDVGALDEVVLVGSPRTLSSAIQRVGRAGHAVGETSRGRIHALHGRDLLDAAVLAPAIEAREGEAVRPVRNPLDVLAQVLLAEAGVEPAAPDDLFARLRRCWSFATLTQEAFDRVVAMLCGKYADARLRELAPRLRLDPETGLLSGRPGALALVYRSGGTIPDRGTYRLRVEGSGARLGELDEEFVWERRVGDEFTIGVQSWRVTRIERDEVAVVPGSRRGAQPPFWRNERQPRDFELCARIGDFLAQVEPRLDDDGLPGELAHTHRLDAEAAAGLIGFLRRQRAVAGRLPHRRRVVVERCASASGEPDAPAVVVIHAPWGARLLQPFQLALLEACEATLGLSLVAYHDDDCLLLQGADDLATDRLLSLVTPDNLEALLRARLEQSGIFAARFRENAMRALLMPRARARERRPLWLSRLRARKLLRATTGHADFPIRVETWRTCLEDEFDLAGLRGVLEEIESGAIEVHEAATAVLSPFAAGVRWRSTNTWMYEQDDGVERVAATVGEQALREVLHDAALRPRLEADLVRDFEQRLLAVDCDDAAGRVDLVERALLVRPWSGRTPRGLARVDWGGGWIVPAALVPRMERGRAGDDDALTALLALHLQARGPRTAELLAGDWEVPLARVREALARLVERGDVIADRLTVDATETEFCDRENLERLLRRRRRARRPDLEARPLDHLPWLLARLHGLQPASQRETDLPGRFDRLLGYPAPAALWERAILPARFEPYREEWLDRLAGSADLLWMGAGSQQVCFALRGELRLVSPRAPEPPPDWPEPRGRYAFFDLQARWGGDSAELARRLWRWAWEGRVTNDDPAALRRAIEHRFRAAPVEARRSGRARWQASRPIEGRWMLLPVDPAVDGLEAAEDERARARLVLARYGVVFRELLARELPPLRWGALARALRMLELSGEVVGGRFFEGVEGLQYASPEALRILRGDPDPEAVWWTHSRDPAAGLAARAMGTWRVHQGAGVRLVLRRDGRACTVHGPLEPRHMAVFTAMLERETAPRTHVSVETIDGEPAARSRHAEAFLAAGFLAEHRKLVRERTYGHAGTRDQDPRG